MTCHKTEESKGVIPEEVADAYSSATVDNLTDWEGPSQGITERVARFLSQRGIETHGIAPIQVENRIDTRWYQMFFVWFSVIFNLSALSTGTSGPAFFGLGLRDSLLTLLVVDVIFCTFPAYSAVFGPKLGMRAMVQSRFSWGYYFSILASILNVFSLQGFLILNCIIGGQTLASVSPDHLDDTLGIVIIAIITLVVTFCGYKVVHWYESVSWVPNVVVFIVMLGLGGRKISLAPSHVPASPASIISFGSTVASSLVSWCTVTPDYGVYHSPKVSSWRIFIYTYIGFLTSSITVHMIGAAFAAAAPSVPSWQAGLGNGNDIGGLFSAILAPSHGFGKFLTVLLALSISSTCAPTMYSFVTSFMAVTPFFAKVPRYVFAIISEAILIPVAIVGATCFYWQLLIEPHNDCPFKDLIGYWTSIFAAIVFVEHFIFRKNDFSRYTLEDWDKPRRLPLGLAALFAFCTGVGIIVPCMSQAWYTGSIAKAGTGDIGLLTGLVVAAFVYYGARIIEKRLPWENRV